MKLNLGSGEEVLDEYINVDIYQKHPEIMNVDLNKLPLPWDDESIDEILLSHIVEHLDQPYEFIMECTRILKSGGKLIVKLPPYCINVQHRRFRHSTSYLNVLFKTDTQGRNYRLQAYELEKFNKNKSIFQFF
jgi:predicted SAM-dependent methyltransferase